LANIFNRSFQIYKYWHNKNVEFDDLYPLYRFRSVEQGRIISVLGNKTVTVNEGEVLYIPPNINATVKCFAEPNTHGTVIRLKYFPDADELEYPFQAFKLTPEITNLLNNMPNLNSNNNITSGMVADIYKIVALMQKNMKKYDDKRAEKLEKALAFMRENDKYSVPQLADLCKMSERRFYAAFKKYTGLTPIQMKQKIQAHKAELLLKSTDISIKEISNEVGFASDTYFRKIIRKRYSRLPKEIRKN